MYKTFGVLLAGLGILASASPVSPAPKHESQLHPRASGSDEIVNGSPANWKDWPFIVDLQLGNGNGHDCGGAILDAYTVLTAAHCAYNTYTGSAHHPSYYVGHVGSNLTASGGYNFTFKAFRIHPDYNPNTLNYDFAILKSSENIYNAGPNIGVTYALLPNNDRAYNGGSLVQVAGWGAQVFRGAQSPYLKQTALQVLDFGKCQRAKYYNNPLTHEEFCVDSTYFLRGTSTCNGDSGGPVMDANAAHIVGVVSFGPAGVCSSSPVPAVFGNVFEVDSWIRNNLG